METGGELRSPGDVYRQGPQARNTRGGPAGRGLRAPRRDLLPQAGPRGAVARLADRRDPGLHRHRGPDRDTAAARVPRPDQRAGAAHQRPCRRRLDREPRRPDRLDPGPGRRAGMQHRGRRAGHRLRAGPQRSPVLDHRRRPRCPPGADRPEARYRRGHRGPGVPLRRAGDRHRLPRLPRELGAPWDGDPRGRLRPDPLPGRRPRRAHDRHDRRHPQLWPPRARRPAAARRHGLDGARAGGDAQAPRAGRRLRRRGAHRGDRHAGPLHVAPLQERDGAGRQARPAARAWTRRRSRSSHSRRAFTTSARSASPTRSC